MRKYFIILVLSFIIFSPNVFAAISNGFILDQIWYSNNSPKEGDTVNIYAAIWNGNTTTLSAKVEFYDKNVILGTRDVTVPSQKLVDVSVSWKVTGGDHSISAKIISSTLNTSSGKKETVILEDSATSTNKKFVPIVVKEEEGKSSTNSDLVKDELNKVTDKIDSVLPESVSNKVSTGVNFLEGFRDETLLKIIDNKKATEEKLSEYKDFADGTKDENMESATERPIAQVKLFFLKALKFIFSNKIIFYGLLIFIIFYFIRGVYRKIRNR
jgi:hypothetical protein